LRSAVGRLFETRDRLNRGKGSHRKNVIGFGGGGKREKRLGFQKKGKG